MMKLRWPFLLCLLATPVFAVSPAPVGQNVQVSNGTTAMTVNSDGSINTNAASSPSAAACKTVTGDADVTIDATAGGVQVLAASATRCGALIQNTSAAGIAMRCLPTSQVVTSAFGTYVDGGQRLLLGTEGQQAWKCIRTTGSSATANPTEVTP